MEINTLQYMNACWEPSIESYHLYSKCVRRKTAREQGPERDEPQNNDGNKKFWLQLLRVSVP